MNFSKTLTQHMQNQQQQTAVATSGFHSSKSKVSSAYIEQGSPHRTLLTDAHIASRTACKSAYSRAE